LGLAGSGISTRGGREVLRPPDLALSHEERKADCGETIRSPGSGLFAFAAAFPDQVIQWLVAANSPLTVAGPRRLRTGFSVSSRQKQRLS